MGGADEEEVAVWTMGHYRVLAVLCKCDRLDVTSCVTRSHRASIARSPTTTSQPARNWWVHRHQS